MMNIDLGFPTMSANTTAMITSYLKDAAVTGGAMAQWAGRTVMPLVIPSEGCHGVFDRIVSALSVVAHGAAGATVATASVRNLTGNPRGTTSKLMAVAALALWRAAYHVVKLSL